MSARPVPSDLRPAAPSGVDVRPAAVVLALAALLLAPGADALVVRDDVNVPPPFLPPVELSDGSRLTATSGQDGVVLSGQVGSALEHFLVRRAVAARHGGMTRVVDRVIVLPSRPVAEPAYARTMDEACPIAPGAPGDGADAH